MSQVAVQKGEPVASRHVIGRSGTTGNSTACHLHFSVMGPDDDQGYYYYRPALFIYAQEDGDQQVGLPGSR
jgi:murein DD-endopeptidase MepM/ murein hydrolase activator NlpD